MKVLIIGSGGREHVLAWKLRKSPLVKEIYCAPGNGGIASIAQCVDIEATDIERLAAFAREKKIDLTVVGPEAPLVAGIVDIFEQKNLKIFGPTRKAARLEGSKVFAKEFMRKLNIPTAPFKVFDDMNEAMEFLKVSPLPLVVKADGLAAGKGVFICAKIQEARDAVEQIMGQKIFKEAGSRIIIEECLIGEEASILAISDGKNYVILDSSQDHKRIFDGDLGPNTGGMGAYSPAPVITEELLRKIGMQIVDPVIRGMNKQGTPFKGVLYAGLMMTDEGPMVLEFNVRFGDPEAQAILPRMKNDLAEILQSSPEGHLEKVKMDWDKRSCVCVVMASGGYPGEYETGKEIKGLDTIKDSHTVVFHAGTGKKDSKIVTAGGRVLGVTSLGETIEQAIERVYNAVEKIKFERCFFRRDIGARALRHSHPAPSQTGMRR
ncbi:MAG: phosphoribosylamine--glycine ligase [Candidatus Omnitrophica bacterium]|nr:phosphoribosylamine--glycine ligase [Candidatus Omnitrophota bacterium]